MKWFKDFDLLVDINFIFIGFFYVKNIIINIIVGIKWYTISTNPAHKWRIIDRCWFEEINWLHKLNAN